MTATMNPYALIRRIIVAALTGTLPDEYREDSVNILTQAMNAPDDDIRALAIMGLNELGAAPPVILPALTDATHDCNDQVRRRAVRSLGDMGLAALPSLPHVICALRDPSTTVRMEAMAALGRFGADAEPAVPDLVALLGHEDMRVRTVAGSTLKKIGKASVPYLADALTDPDAILRERAAALLGRLRVKDEHILEALLEVACSDYDEDVRQAARGALELIQA
jgi:HEAT repeat protein